MFFFFFHAPATPEIYTLSLHDALPISAPARPSGVRGGSGSRLRRAGRFWRLREAAPEMGCPRRSLLPEPRSEEHTSELQSRFDLVCRLLLEKKKKTQSKYWPLRCRQSR